jgi:hypothetical protein
MSRSPDHPILTVSSVVRFCLSDVRCPDSSGFRSPFLGCSPCLSGRFCSSDPGDFARRKPGSPTSPVLAWRGGKPPRLNLSSLLPEAEGRSPERSRTGNGAAGSRTTQIGEAHFAALCLRPSASPPSPIAPLLKTKTKVQFDRAVTERSKPLIPVFRGFQSGSISSSNCLFYFPVGRGSQLPKYQIPGTNYRLFCLKANG